MTAHRTFCDNDAIPQETVAYRWASRCADILFASLALAVLSPVFVVVGAMIFLFDGLPVFFLQHRIGMHGKRFRILKFRTMRCFPTGASGFEPGNHSRITCLGRFLRKYKLDELPQFVNILVGDMAFVGPRPEVPEHVNLANPAWRVVLSWRPGLSDPASIYYRREEDLLASSDDPQSLYVNTILPHKLSLSTAFLDRRSLAADFAVLAGTVQAILSPPKSK